MTTLISGPTVIGPEEFADHVVRIAGGFDRLGIGDGDVVALMLKNDPIFVEAMVATRKIGAYYCPINWHFKADEVNYILRDSGAQLLVIHGEFLPQIEGAIPPGMPVLVVTSSNDTLSEGMMDWHKWIVEQPPYTGPERRPRGFMPYTSGTTGRSKGVRREPATADNLLRLLELARRTYGIEQGMKTLMVAPMYHAAPNVVALYAAISDGTIVIEPRFDAERALSLIEQHALDHTYLVPTLMVRLLRLPESVRQHYDLSSIRFVACTGSSCPPAVKSEMIKWWGPVIYEQYAASELGTITIINSQEAMQKPGSAGKPVEGALLKILDAKDNEVPCDTVGTIYARQHLFPDFTYNNNDAARRAVERDGLISCGDMGYVDADGYLFICDRATDMVISGGVNIYPAEIEHVLIGMPGVEDCAVFGIPDAEYGEALLAAVQMREGHAADSDAVKTFLAKRIAGYKVPRHVEFHASLPREETGKIFKRKLRDPHWAKAGRRI
jgi:long-chain acyl-CoA synthetase